MRRTWLTLVGLGLLLLAVWLPRALALEHVVTPDERKWLARAANFDYAVAQQDWRATFQREHPGVTVMWAGALGLAQTYPAYAQETPGYFGWEQEELEAWLRANDGPPPLELLNAGRRWIILFVMLAALVAFAGLARLWGGGLALLTLIYVALDPFFVAHSFQLHPDGLLAMLVLAAAATFLAWLYAGGRWPYLLASGVALGLAGLTKTPAIFLVAAALLLCLVEMVRQRLAFGPMLGGLVVWGGTAVATVFLLWPALWVDPVGTLDAMARELLVYAEGHINPNFFLGEPTQAPGPLYYAAAYLLRSTPLTLLGLMGVAFLAVRRRWPLADASVRRSAGGLLVMALVFAAGITLGAKKFDRYFLPAALLLDAMAVLGLAGLASMGIALIGRLFGRRPNRGRMHNLALLTVLLAALVGHGGMTVHHRPYFLTYYNPLLGGAPMAERVVMIGWGEGLDQAAAWLQSRPDAEQSDVVAWYGDGPLSYFLDRARPVLNVWQPDFWLDADYAVVYVNQRQRDIPSAEALRAIEAGETLHVVRRNGVDWVRIHQLPEAPPAFTGLQTESAAVFDDRIELAAYTLGEPSVLAGDSFLLRLHLRRLDDQPLAVRQIVRLLGPDGAEITRAETPLDAASLTWLPYAYHHSYAELTVPEQAPQGAYRIAVDFCPIDTPDRCLTPAGHTVTSVDVQRSVSLDERFVWPEVELYDVRYDLATAPGAPLLINAAADLRTAAPLKLSLRIAREDGQVIAQADVPLAGAMEITLETPSDAPPGAYALIAVVYDPETLAAFADQAGAFETRLTTVRIGDPEDR